VVLIFESVDEILLCDHSNYLFSITFTWYYLYLSILQNKIWDLSSEFSFWAHLEVKRVTVSGGAQRVGT